MQEKLLVEKSSIAKGDFASEFTSCLISFPEIEKQLQEGWSIKQMTVQPCGSGGSEKPERMVIVVHLQRP